MDAKELLNEFKSYSMPTIYNLYKYIDNIEGKFHPEIKYEGHFYYLCKIGSEKILTNRSKNKNVYSKSFDLPEIPDNTIVAGELYLKNQPDTNVPTAIKNNDSNLIYVIHTIIALNGEFLNIYNTVRNRLILENTIDSRYLVKRLPVVNINQKNIESVYNEYYSYVKENNIEGIVLKSDLTWLKIKTKKDIDCFVISKNIKNNNLVYNMGIYDENNNIIEICKISNLPKNINLNKNDVVRVIYEGNYNSKKLKHAIFNCVRTDKTYIECKMSQF